MTTETSPGSTTERATAMNLAGVHHVAIRVQDPAATRKWWEEVVGLQFMELPATNTHLWRGAPDSGMLIATQIGNTYFIFAPPLEGTPSGQNFSEKQIGLDHIAFAVQDRGELDGLLGRLRSAGSTTEGIETDPVMGKEYICFRDPNNLQVEAFML